MKKAEISKLSIPSKSFIDDYIVFGRGFISEFPGGAILAEILETKYERRMREFIVELAQAVNCLIENHQSSKSALINNEDFCDAVYRSILIASRNRQEMKREALRNIVHNAAIKQTVESSELFLFLNLIDQFTEWHIIILNLLSDPKKFIDLPAQLDFSSGSNTLNKLIESVYPELKEKHWMSRVIIKDLFDIEFIKFESAWESLSGENMFMKHTLPAGERFLEYISITDEQE